MSVGLREISLVIGVVLCSCSSSGSPSTTPAPTPTVPDPTAPPGPDTPTLSAHPNPGHTVGRTDDPRLFPYRGWTRESLGEMPAQWQMRDGEQMVQLPSGRILMIGGWSAYDPWGPNYVPDVGGGDRLTNEVWKSDDLGKTWSLLLPHDKTPPTSGPNARFPPGHAVCVTRYKGHAIVMGNDASQEVPQVADVWQESNDGATWTRVGTEAPTLDTFLFMCGALKDDLYVMGGCLTPEDPSTGLNTVWRSQDGGVSWSQLPNAPWAPRGMVYRPVEHNGKLVIVGGGLYGDVPYIPIAYNGVYAFDGTNWTTVLPDGHKQFIGSIWNTVVSIAGRLWLFNGFDPTTEANADQAVYSDDDGKTWSHFAGGAGGAPSHADATVVAGGKLIRVAGSLDERTIWEFSPPAP